MARTRRQVRRPDAVKWSRDQRRQVRQERENRVRQQYERELQQRPNSVKAANVFAALTVMGVAMLAGIFADLDSGRDPHPAVSTATETVIRGIAHHVGHAE